MSGGDLASRLRDATQVEHRLAERSAFMRRLLQGNLGIEEYCRLIRNLHALYAVIEESLEQHASCPEVAPMCIREIFRAQALAEDLDYLHGRNWTSDSLAAAMLDYIEQIRHLSATCPTMLAAHVYVRYMGDLSGGQMVREIIRRTYTLPTMTGTRFYDFDHFAEPAKAKSLLRAALNRLPVEATQQDAIAEEAKSGFSRHLCFFEELENDHRARI